MENVLCRRRLDKLCSILTKLVDRLNISSRQYGLKDPGTFHSSQGHQERRWHGSTVAQSRVESRSGLHTI